ncbi:MAG: protease complex subunit PrcB family protein [Nitrospinae bacterium]|nr:protease complex subunit PrcB family protein [Nitrospinota bacterium]
MKNSGKKIIPIFILLHCFLFSSCASQPRLYEVMDRGIRIGRHSPDFHFEAINSPEKFEQAFKLIYSNVLPSPAVPQVDFQEFFVFLASAGEKPTAGYGMELKKVTWQGDLLIIELFLNKPSPGTMQAQVLTNPFLLFKVKRAAEAKEVEVRDQNSRVLFTLHLHN